MDIRRHATDIQKMIMRDQPGVALRNIGVVINYWPVIKGNAPSSLRPIVSTFQLNGSSKQHREVIKLREDYERKLQTAALHPNATRETKTMDRRQSNCRA